MGPVSDQRLIDTGPTEWGFHRYEDFMRCPLLYYWNRVVPGGQEAISKKPPLIKGTMVHVALAHYYAEGIAPDEEMPPLAALELCAERIGGTEFLPRIREAFGAYIAHYGAESVQVLGVEKLYEIRFGAAPYTARVDLVVEDNDGKVWFWDHKSGRPSMTRYDLSGQFFGLDYIGRLHYGEKFGGVRGNFFGLDSPFKFTRETPSPAPWMWARYPKSVERSWRRLMELETHPRRMDPELWAEESMPSEFLCVTPYGPCECRDGCKWGRGEQT